MSDTSCANTETHEGGGERKKEQDEERYRVNKDIVISPIIGCLGNNQLSILIIKIDRDGRRDPVQVRGCR